MIISDQWGQVPGIVLVAPRFQFFDAADAAKIIEEEVGMYSTYKPHWDVIEKCGRAFAKSCIPIVPFWL